MTTPVRLKTLLTNEISPLLEAAGGVAQVTVTGGQDRAVIVDVDPVRLQAYGLALGDVTRRIAAENVSLPAGLAGNDVRETTIRSTGYFTSVAEAAKVPLGVYGGRIVTLGDVAQVRDAGQEQRVFTRIDGEKAVGISVSKQSEANTVQTSQNVEAKIREIGARYPDLKFTVAYGQAGFVEKSIASFRRPRSSGGCWRCW